MAIVSNVQRRGQWHDDSDLDILDERVARAADVATLLRWARESLPSAAVPCLGSPRLCLDGSCLRCNVERIVWEPAPEVEDDGPAPF